MRPNGKPCRYFEESVLPMEQWKNQSEGRELPISFGRISVCHQRRTSVPICGELLIRKRQR